MAQSLVTQVDQNGLYVTHGTLLCVCHLQPEMEGDGLFNACINLYALAPRIPWWKRVFCCFSSQGDDFVQQEAQAGPLMFSPVGQTVGYGCVVTRWFCVARTLTLPLFSNQILVMTCYQRQLLVKRASCLS
jgi:hypothetical protein